MRDLSSSPSPEANIAKQTDFAKQSFENMMNDFKELSEMYSESSMDAFEIMSEQLNNSIKKFAQSASPVAKKASVKKTSKSKDTAAKKAKKDVK